MTQFLVHPHGSSSKKVKNESLWNLVLLLIFVMSNSLYSLMHLTDYNYISRVLRHNSMALYWASVYTAISFILNLHCI